MEQIPDHIHTLQFYVHKDTKIPKNPLVITIYIISCPI